MNNSINNLLINLPAVIAAFGYGSGIKKQTNYSQEELKKTQDDFIIIVENSRKWHRQNMKMNSKNYTLWQKILFTLSIPVIERMGTGVSYIAYQKYNNEEDHYYKLGVVQENVFTKELSSLRSLSLAGRLSKPTLKLKSNDEIDSTINNNYHSFLLIGLLLLENNEHTLKDLLYKICSISYDGDIRMKSKYENPSKQKDIVNGSYEEFLAIYGDDNLYYTKESNSDNIVIHYDEILAELQNMPTDIYKKLENIDKFDLVKLKNILHEYIIKSNKRSSKLLALKSFITTGPIQSIKYLKRKKEKYNKSISK